MSYRYNPKNNRNGGYGPWPYILLFIGIFSGIGIFIPIAIVWIIIANAQQNDSTVYTQRYRTNSRSNYRAASSNKRTRVRINKYDVNQMKLINSCLKEYFASYTQLPVFDDVNLRIKLKSYRSLNSLNVFKNNDYVCSLSEFGKQYPDKYNQILRLLLSFASDTKRTYSYSKEVKVAPKVVEDNNKQVSKSIKYIEEIDELNVAIPDEVISNGLYESCSLLKQISQIEQQHPESKEKLDKLYEYYLPILINILKQYQALQDVPNTDKFVQTKQKLEKSIILINEAMKTLTMTLYEDDVINLSADISTLEAILKKDGLVDNGIKVKKTLGE